MEAGGRQPKSRPAWTATYRLQLEADRGFSAARGLVPYLADLGVSHLYLSPVFAARPGSAHGYDVVDPTRLNPELGTDEDFRALIDTLHDHDMGLLLDIVPNHMAVHWANRWWWDVLEKGRESRFAHFFDIAWTPDEAKVLVPVLGASLEEALDGGEIRLEQAEIHDQTTLLLRYHEHLFPVRPGSWGAVLERALRSDGEERVRRRLACVLTLVEELERLEEGFDEGPGGRHESKQARREVVERTEEIKRELGRVLSTEPAARALIKEAVDDWNGDPAALRRLLAAQHFRPVHFRTTAEEPTYRRFFDIGDLIGVRVEDEEVMRATHSLVLDLVENGDIDGLRIDHIDGLLDPEGYLDLLARLATERGRPDTRLLVEKILAPDEDLPSSWPVAGTSGYEVLNRVNHAFVDPVGLQELDHLYRRFTGDASDFNQVVYESKRQVIEELFPAELNALTRGIEESGLVPSDRGLGHDALRDGLLEVTACLSVYRTYAARGVGPVDTWRTGAAVDEAQRRNPGRLASALAFLRRFLTLELPDLDAEGRARSLALIGRWQQLSGPAMAKGLEDTAFYRYHRLLSLNEVGGEADLEQEPADDLHAHFEHIAVTRPATLHPASTHDTKRSEDARARLDVLSHRPRDWADRVGAWDAQARHLEREVDGRIAPSPAERLMLYQSLVAVWEPDRPTSGTFVERMTAFLVKALREGKVNSSWLRPDSAYEDAAVAYAIGLLEGEANDFSREIDRFVTQIAPHAALVSLAQTAVRLTAPGVPDIYQGNELWDLSLVDPDNRRPVDFERRRNVLAQGATETDATNAETTAGAEERQRLPTDFQTGEVKLRLINRLLRLRQVFTEPAAGDYIPLQGEGPAAAELFAFLRYAHRRWLLTAVPRFPGKGGFTVASDDRLPVADRSYWEGTELLLPPEAPADWRNVITGESVTATGERPVLRPHEIWAAWPLAVLEAHDDGDQKASGETPGH